MKGFQFEYKPCKNAIRNKRVIVCKYANCGKEFTKSWNFLDHARMHEGLKPFVCDICSKAFTQSGNMKKHIKQHSVEDVKQRKRYKCEYCDKCYTEKFNLKVRSPSNRRTPFSYSPISNIVTLQKTQYFHVFSKECDILNDIFLLKSLIFGL